MYYSGCKDSDFNTDYNLCGGTTYKLFLSFVQYQVQYQY